MTIETDEVLIIHAGRGSLTCDLCRAQMLRPEQAVMLTRVSAREIHRLIEAGLVPFVETPEGLLLVCIGSLTQSIIDV